MNDKIDFVITWVDGNDKIWREKKNKYLKEEDPNCDSADERYRDWEFLKYWFRAIEKNADWFNKVIFITEGHIPDWLNMNNSRLIIKKHDEFIPQKDLPTFNSCAIEVNFKNIDELSEKFIYFNDDMFINRKVYKKDFFRNNLPIDSCLISPIRALDKQSTGIEYNCLKLINRHFNYNEFKHNNFSKIYNLKLGKRLFKNITLSIYDFFPGFAISHLPCAFLKSTYVDAWNKCSDELEIVSSHKFRKSNDLSQWLFQYWQFASGNFYTRSWNFGKYYNVSKDLKKIIDDVKNAKHKLICINDDSEIQDFSKTKAELINTFEKRYPDKSSFEK